MPDVNDYFARAALGRVEGHEQYLKYGVNNSIDTGSPQDILSQGGDVQILSSNQPCDIVSTSPLDTLGGTGCNVVAVFGVNQDLEIVEELVQMNGTTPVILENQYIAIWRLRNAVSGSLRVNQGIISINTLADTLLGQMPLGKGSSLTTLMVVPKGFNMLIYDVFINMGVIAGSNVVRRGVVTVRTLNYQTNAETVQAEIGLRDTYEVKQTYRMPLRLTEGNFIWFRADSVEANNTAIQASFTFELVNL